MQGRIDEGHRLPALPRQADWGDSNLFTVHNWWHLALYLLEAGRQRRGTGDLRPAHPPRTDPPVSRWRCSTPAPCCGVCTSTTTTPAADSPHSPKGGPRAPAYEPWYTFNDLHAVIAFAGAGRLADARAVIARLEALRRHRPRRASNVSDDRRDRPARHPGQSSRSPKGATTPPSAKLAPIRTTLARFGGSHAQRDALQRTLVGLRHPPTASSTWPGALLDERLPRARDQRLVLAAQRPVWSSGRPATPTGAEHGRPACRRPPPARFAGAAELNPPPPFHTDSLFPPPPFFFFFFFI